MSRPFLPERQIALAAGELLYLPSLPCKRGHMTERYTKTGHCKECSFLNSENYRTQFPERRAASNKKWYEANIEERREKARASNRKQAAENPEKKRLQSGRGRAKFYKLHPEIKRNADAARRAARHNRAEIILTRTDVAGLIARANGVCVACLKTVPKIHADHIVPLAKGGSHLPHNLQALCPACNCSKRHKDPVIWATEQGFVHLIQDYVRVASVESKTSQTRIGIPLNEVTGSPA